MKNEGGDQQVRSLHVRGHTCTLRPLTSPRGGRKGGATSGVTSSKSHTSNFANRLQEKTLQSTKEYGMEKVKIHDIHEPYVR